MTAPSIVSPQGQVERDIALLKDLRARTTELVADSRAFSTGLSASFGGVRDEISRLLAYALLQRELYDDERGS